MLNNNERENIIRTFAFVDAGRELAHTCKIQTFVDVIVFLSSPQPFSVYIDRPIDSPSLNHLNDKTVDEMQRERESIALLSNASEH